jgi:hypothetical protein
MRPPKPPEQRRLKDLLRSLNDTRWERHPNGHDRRLTPGGRWHQWWCAVFQGKSCDCDDLRDPPPKLRSPLSGGGEPVPAKKKRKTVVKKRQQQLEDA